MDGGGAWGHRWSHDAPFSEAHWSSLQSFVREAIALVVSQANAGLGVRT